MNNTQNTSVTVTSDEAVKILGKYVGEVYMETPGRHVTLFVRVVKSNLVWQMNQCPDIMWQIVDSGDTLTVFIDN